MSEENYMRIIDLRGKKLTRAEMLEAMPRAEMGTNEATELVQPILDDVKARGAAALRDFAEKFDHIRPEHLRVPVEAMKAAVDNGAKVVVCAGFMQGTALEKAAKEFTDTKFVFIDGWSLGLDNVAGIAFNEEQCGYFAGYAVVKEGYEKLGFTGGGGGTNPACIRYGWGFAQGANDAAKEMDKTVDLNYSWEYGASFQASPELQTMVSGWYSNGTEIVFACGGSMFASVVAAAGADDGKVIGVDVDQAGVIASYAGVEGMTVTSAMKGLSDAASWAIAKVYDGTWDEIGNAATSLGVAENAVGLPTATWSMENFSVADYEDLFQKVLNGDITIDNNSEMANPAEGGLTNVNVNYIGG